MVERDNTFAMTRKAEDGTDQCVGRGEWIDATEAQYDTGNPLFAAILIVGFYEIGGFSVAVPVRRMSREHLR